MAYRRCPSASCTPAETSKPSAARGLTRPLLIVVCDIVFVLRLACVSPSCPASSEPGTAGGRPAISGSDRGASRAPPRHDWRKLQAFSTIIGIEHRQHEAVFRADPAGA